jgi:hypothetical protein
LARQFLTSRHFASCSKATQGSFFSNQASAIQPSVPLLVGNIYGLSKYWTDRFPREPREKVKPSECCDYERNGKQERPKLSYHNQGTLTAAVGNTMRLRF